MNTPPNSSTLIRPAVDDDAAELAALRLLQCDPMLSQCQLSSALGLSLGKTRYILRALLHIVAIKAQTFRRNDNKRAYMYLLTPAVAIERSRFKLDATPQSKLPEPKRAP